MSRATLPHQAQCWAGLADTGWLSQLAARLAVLPSFCHPSRWADAPSREADGRAICHVACCQAQPSTGDRGIVSVSFPWETRPQRAWCRHTQPPPIPMIPAIALLETRRTVDRQRPSHPTCGRSARGSHLCIRDGNCKGRTNSILAQGAANTSNVRA